MTGVASAPPTQTRSIGPRLGGEAMRARFPPRPVAVTWPTVQCDRQTAIRLATAAPLVISNPAVQAKRIRGLRHLLDWLTDQPGNTWISLSSTTRSKQPGPSLISATDRVQ